MVELKLDGSMINILISSYHHQHQQPINNNNKNNSNFLNHPNMLTRHGRYVLKTTTTTTSIMVATIDKDDDYPLLKLKLVLELSSMVVIPIENCYLKLNIPRRLPFDVPTLWFHNHNSNNNNATSLDEEY
eukprot:scaffold11396_cov104-Cylindrotheca_fusiformis.AAC.2